jgi:predicted metal-dependent HD superfamily phosphohydrolase
VPGPDGRAFHATEWFRLDRATVRKAVGAAFGSHPVFGAVAFDEVELAFFFHDAVYDAHASDNKVRSATLLPGLAGCAPAIEPEAVARVVGLIKATAAHAPGSDLTMQLLLDLDLAMLGAQPDRYAGYAAAIRWEYAHVLDALWRTGRSAVLERVLARDRLYQTGPFQALLESQARASNSGERARLLARS